MNSYLGKDVDSIPGGARNFNQYTGLLVIYSTGLRWAGSVAIIEDQKDYFVKF